MISFNIIILASALGALFSFSAADFDGNKEVGFYIYTSRADSLDGVKIEIGDDEGLKKSGFDPKFKTAMIVHGFDDSYAGKEVSELKTAYLEKTDYNVIMVDWSGLAEHLKDTRVHARDIGQHMGRFVLYLGQNHGEKFGDIHLVGHEHGAHIAGFVSDLVTSPKVGRITGLDPMGLSEWEQKSPMDSLDPEDAVLVDVFHTSSVGIKKLIGHVDFYPNGGMNQTHCKTDNRPPTLCDTLSSLKYFTDSIYNPENYMAVKCNTIEEATSGSCSGETAQLGEFMQPTTSGIYYKAI